MQNGVRVNVYLLNEVLVLRLVALPSGWHRHAVHVVRRQFVDVALMVRPQLQVAVVVVQRRLVVVAEVQPQRLGRVQLFLLYSCVRRHVFLWFYM